MDHKEMLESFGDRLEKFLTTKTVVGEPIRIGEVILVPIQNASFGFGSGGGEGRSEKDLGTGGGTGGGASLRPVAIVAVIGTEVRMYTLGKKGALEGLVELIPEALSKVKLSRGKGAKGDSAGDFETGESGKCDDPR